MKKRNILYAGFMLLGSVLTLSSCGKSDKNNGNDAESEAVVVDTKVDPAEPVAELAQAKANFFSEEANIADNLSAAVADNVSAAAADNVSAVPDSIYKTTSTGLRYKTITEGTGKQPSFSSNVTVHYEGWLPDGTKFDSSVDRGEPTTFPLNGVIPGWTEGLMLMKEGGTATFVIPSELAYGERGVPGTIPPNTPLIFWVKLIKVN